MQRRQGVTTLLLAALALASLFPSASAFSWRLFAGREECIAEYLPANQWKYIQNHLEEPLHAPVYVDLGFLVTSKYGTEETKAAVDYGVYGPDNVLLQHENGVSEAEVGVHAVGSNGPWRICFRVSSGALLRPSVIVKLSYFVVNFDEYVSEGFDWEDTENVHADPNKPHPDELGSREQIESLQHGLLRLDHYLHNVTNEQRHLYSRTMRHMKTAQSTLRRTFWYYSALYVVICLASFSQLVVVRMMFKKSRKQGLII